MDNCILTRFSFCTVRAVEVLLYGLGCLLLLNVCPSRCGRVRRPQQYKIVLCVHSMREHTDVIETGNEVSYDICRNVDIRVSWCINSCGGGIGSGLWASASGTFVRSTTGEVET